MKKRFILLALPVGFVVAMAFASPPNDGPDTNGFQPEIIGRPMHMMPPKPEPVYSVTQQTDRPNEVIKTIASQVPQISAGKYMVRIEVIPLPPKGPGEATSPKNEPVK